jgi:Lecithin:cholesterol acyltransferase
LKRLGDIVIVLPGITGSILQKDGRDLWAPTIEAVTWSAVTRGRALEHLILKGDDPTLDDLDDGIRATGLMSIPHAWPGVAKADGYSQISRMINDNFKIEPPGLNRPTNFIEFPYDWRRTNQVAARKLQTLIKRELPEWRAYSGYKDAKVILLAHSMGGLVSRYYLEVLEGWRDCRALVTFGTPYRGSVSSLDTLVNGSRKFGINLTEAARSFTAMYELLPIYECVSVNTSCSRITEIEDEIPGVNREMATRALEFHRDIENAVKKHQKLSEYHEHGYKVIPFVGTQQPTLQSACFDKGHLQVSRDLPRDVSELLSEGDGTVPRLSAIPIELSDEYRDTFVPERHASLQKNNTVLNDLRNRLEQMQVRGLKQIRGSQLSTNRERGAISLDMEDLYSTGGTTEIRVQLMNVRQQAPPRARIETAMDGCLVLEQAFLEDSTGWTLRLEGLKADLYRIEVESSVLGPGAPTPVCDLFEVKGDL